MYINNDEYVLSLERKISRMNAREQARKARIKKATIAITVTLTLLAIPTASIAHSHSQLSNWKSTREVITVHVQPGEGIDHYWAEYAPSWMPPEIYREAIKELNNMSDSCLRAGQTLKIYVN